MKDVKKVSAVIVSCLVLLGVGVSVVQAAAFTLPNPFACGTPCTLFTLLSTIIDKIILPIGGVLAVLSFIYAGFLYVTAQGSADKLKTAHKALLYTSVGTAVLLGSWVLAKVIENTINQLK